MHRILLLLILFCLGKNLSAQYVYTIKADSVKITNSCDTAELIVENHTQNVPGFLFNKGKGRTEFRKGLLKLNDSLYRIGADTLKIPKPAVITASNGLSMVGNSVQFGFANGQGTAGTLLTSDRYFPMNGYNLNFQNGNIVLQNQVTGSANPTLLSLSTGWNTTANPTALSISAANTASSLAQLLALNLLSSGNRQSNYLVRAYESSLGFDYYDYTQSNAYLMIRSNNINSGNSGSSYGAGGVITLQGYYNQSAGSGGMTSAIYDASKYGPTDAGGTIGYCSYRIQPSITSSSTGTVRGIYYGLVGPGSIPNNNNIAFENYNGNLLLNNQAGDAGGRTAIHINGNAPAAWLHLGAGLATANAAPLKFTSGTVLNAPEDGAIEYDGTDLYLTTSSVRYSLSKTLKGQLTTNFGGASLAAWSSVTTILSVAGAQAGDVVNVSDNNGTVNPPSIIISAYITSANTVTIRAYNASNSAVTLASDTYKVRVIK
jgi:hypothetical protein